MNIVTSVGGGSNNNWAIQNMVVDFNSLSDLKGGEGAPTVNFDLGQTDGAAVSSLNYSITLSGAPLGLEPSGPVTNSATVAQTTQVNGTTTDVTIAGDESEEPAADFVGAGANTGPSRGGSGSIATNETSVPKVSESLNGCAPG